jgi:hypothetical protein
MSPSDNAAWARPPKSEWWLLGKPDPARYHPGHAEDADCPELKKRGFGAIRPTLADLAAATPLSGLMAAAGVAPVAALAASFRVPREAGILDQDGTSQCVAFGLAWLQLFHALRDEAPFRPDPARFFREIGGVEGVGSALIPNGLEHLRLTGFPEVGVASEGLHRIAAWAKVDVAYGAIKTAIATYQEPVTLISPWYHSWFHPYASGVLPPPDYSVGGHCWDADGWDDTKTAQGAVDGVCQWGTDFANGGHFYLPAAYLSRVWAVAKTTDVKNATKRSMAAGAKVRPDVHFGAALGSIAAGAAISTLPAVTGDRWTSPSGATGTKWYPVVAINGQWASTLYGRKPVYVYAGAVKGG